MAYAALGISFVDHPASVSTVQCRVLSRSDGTHTHHPASVLGSPEEGVGGSRLSASGAVSIGDLRDSTRPRDNNSNMSIIYL